jgi:alpha-tubulin suppressor-like RCC1 family protein
MSRSSRVVLLLFCAALACEKQPTRLELPPIPLSLLHVDAGTYATCGSRFIDTYCWGDGFHGQLGFPSDSDCVGIPSDPQPCAPAPGKVATTAVFSVVSTGGAHACALAVVGDVYCWGDGQFGQVGITPLPDTCASPPAGCAKAPVLVATGPFTQVSTGDSHSCAVASGGVVYCWGYGAYGRLGSGGASNQPVPEAVQDTNIFYRVAAGGSYTCALAVDSLAYCWGYNHLGQLGTSSQATELLPTPVAGGHKFVQISAGIAHTCAITPQGEAWCWGGGELGTSTAREDCGGYPCNTQPVLVAGGLVFTEVEAGHGFTCGVTTTASYCWGEAPGLAAPATAPVPFGTLGTAGGDPFIHFGAGYDHACGITQSLDTYCWGSDYHGKLGDGPGMDTTNAPVMVLAPPPPLPIR